MTDKNRQAFEAYFRGCAIANGKDEAWISKNLERAEDGTYMRAPAYDGWCYWMAAKDFKAIDQQSKPGTSRNLCAYYYSFESTGCDLIDSVLESVANAGSGYHHTEDWREEYDDGSSPLSNMQKTAEESATSVQELIAENKRLAALLECAQGDCRQAMQIIEKLTPEADLYQQIQIAAGSLPSSWEIALRVENGYGGVDLIDPHGTVVDLDDVDSTLGESVAGAVAFAIAKEASHV